MNEQPAAPVRRPVRPASAIGLAAAALIGAVLGVVPAAAQQPEPSNPIDPYAPVPQLYVAPPIEHPAILYPEGLADGYALGDPEAPVTVEVWEDFQCPYCRLFTAQVEPLIVGTYVVDGRVRYIFHQLPFLGEESRWAAVAADLAAEQDRFWPMHSYIYANWMGENRRAMTPARLWDMAQAAGLDMEPFTAGMEIGAARARWQKVIEAAEASAGPLGISSTPTVAVQGTVLENPGWDFVQPAVEAALTASGASQAPEDGERSPAPAASPS